MKDLVADLEKNHTDSQRCMQTTLPPVRSSEQQMDISPFHLERYGENRGQELPPPQANKVPHVYTYPKCGCLEHTTMVCHQTTKRDGSDRHAVFLDPAHVFGSVLKSHSIISTFQWARSNRRPHHILLPKGPAVPHSRSEVEDRNESITHHLDSCIHHGNGGDHHPCLPVNSGRCLTH